MHYDDTITLPPYGSLFVCFGQNAVSRVEKGRFSQRETTIHPEGFMKKPWDVTFRESGLTLKDQQPFDWSKHSDDKIRYFSGHARYTLTWKLKKKRGTHGSCMAFVPQRQGHCSCVD